MLVNTGIVVQVISAVRFVLIPLFFQYEVSPPLNAVVDNAFDIVHFWFI